MICHVVSPQGLLKKPCFTEEIQMNFTIFGLQFTIVV